MYSAHLSWIFFSFSKMMLLFVCLFFWLKTSCGCACFLSRDFQNAFVHCLLRTCVYFKFLHFSLAVSYFFLIGNVSYISLLFFRLIVPKRSKISSAIHLCCVFFSTLGISSTADSVTDVLNFTHCWSTSSASLKTSKNFLNNHTILFSKALCIF